MKPTADSVCRDILDALINFKPINLTCFSFRSAYPSGDKRFITLLILSIGINSRPCLVLLIVVVNLYDSHMKSSKMIWFMSYVCGLAAAVMATIAAGMPDIRSMLNGSKDSSENFFILLVSPYLLITINWNIWNKSYFQLRIKIWMKVNTILAVEWSCSLDKIYYMFKITQV